MTRKYYHLTVFVFLCGNLMLGQINDLMLVIKPGKDLTTKPALTQHIKSDSSTRVSDDITELKSLINKDKLITHTDNEYTGNDIKIINHSGFISAMNKTYNLPAWVAHAVTKYNLEHPDPEVKRDASSYPSDPSYTIIKSNAYQSSGYDHGHLAPARDFKHSKTQFAECFYMTNMSPQHGCLNQKGWCVLEDYCRIWTKEDGDAVSYIVSGPLLTKHTSKSIFIDSLCIKTGLTVFVPRYFFKAICIYNEKNKTARAIAFVVANKELSVKNLDKYAIPIDELEELLELDFFSSLPDKLESSTESLIGKFNFLYDKKEFDCIDKDCDKMYVKRVKPDKRKVLNCK